MYCTDCGTVNSDGAESCLKCGKVFSAASSADHPLTVAELTMQRPADLKTFYPTSSGGRFGRPSRMLVITMAIIITAILPIVIIALQMSATGKDRPKAKEGSVFEMVQSVKDGKLPDMESIPGVGVDSDNAPGDGDAKAADPLKLIGDVDNDIARQARAQRLTMMLATYYSQNDKYPEKITDLNEEDLGFKPDPEVFQYELTTNPYGFVLKVVLLNKYPDRPGVVEENGVYKLEINGRY